MSDIEILGLSVQKKSTLRDMVPVEASRTYREPSNKNHLSNGLPMENSSVNVRINRGPINDSDREEMSDESKESNFSIKRIQGMIDKKIDKMESDAESES